MTNSGMRGLPLTRLFNKDGSVPDTEVEFHLAQHHAEHLHGATPEQAHDMALDYMKRMAEARQNPELFGFSRPAVRD